jgi:glycosyltransferase involved in cell wall biosynthesis
VNTTARPSGPEPVRCELSVVIPVYRSAPTVPTLVQRLTTVLDGEGLDYEIVLVDDSSPDDSWAAMQHQRELHGDRVRTIQLMRNYGQHNALMCGLGQARGEVVVTMDDDLQNPPEEIPALLRHLRAHDLDLVYGVPDARNHAAWRNVGAQVVLRFYRTVFHNDFTPTPFRAMKRRLVQSILFYDLNFTYIDGLLAWCTNRIGSVTVQHHGRAHGRSGYSASRLLVLALNLYTNFSLLPLQVVSILGLATSALGISTGAYYLLQFLTANIDVPGYASTIIAILVLGGIQLLALGVIGEYLGRLHLNVNRKPQYVIRHIDGPRPPLDPTVVPSPALHGIAPGGRP